MKVLCFHGFNQNSEIMMKKCKIIMDRFKKVKFDFIDAVHTISEEHPTRYWWCNDRTNPLNMTWNQSDDLPSKEMIGLDKSIIYVREFIAQNGPYDGLLGFSQGAALINILLARNVVNVDFAILFCGFTTEEIKRPLNIPSVHVFGSSDKTVEPVHSAQLASQYTTPIIIEHPGTHVILSTAVVLNPMRRLFSLKVKQDNMSNDSE